MRKTLIIAEAGVNHNGDIELAHQLIDKAVYAGVDVIKFQTFIAANIVDKAAEKADYQKNNTGNSDETQYQMLKNLELKFSQFVDLKKYANSKGLSFLSTGFDIESTEFLIELGMPFFKIPSGEITNKRFLQRAASLDTDIILSTGMATKSEIGEALKVLTDAGMKKNQITVLHCTTDYPTVMSDVNLRAMLDLQSTFNVEVGYSDHTIGIEVPIAAVALGAKVIEKHFTLDKNMAGPDHKASIEPEDLKRMVDGIRNVEMAMEGSGIKEPTLSELKNTAVARKSIFIKNDLKKGDKIKEEDLSVKRPGTGISPMLIDQVIGKELIVDITSGTLLKTENIL